MIAEKVTTKERLEVENPDSPQLHVLQFEEDLKKYTGADYCIVCDSATNAISTLLDIARILFEPGENVSIPKHTYLSVYNQLVMAGFDVNLSNEIWSKYYTIDLGRSTIDLDQDDLKEHLLSIGLNSGKFKIIDSAGTLMANQCRHYNYSNYDDVIDNENIFTVVSFGSSKPLSLGVGGAILFNKFNHNSENIYNILKRFIHDGRDSSKPVNEEIENGTLLKFDLFEPGVQDGQPFGEHYPLSTRLCAEGSVLLKEYKLKIKKGTKFYFPNSKDYPDLSKI